MGEPAEDVSLADEVSIQITRLLDVPTQDATLRGNKNYIVRVFDASRQTVLATSKPIESISHAEGYEVETINVPGHVGLLKMHTTQPMLHVQVEHEGAILGHSLIGSCQIYRLDQRSATVCGYSLSHDNGENAHCGVELQVIEGALPREYLQRESTMAGHAGASLTLEHGIEDVAAVIDIDKVTDLPQPTKHMSRPQVLLVMECADPGWEERELAKAGPFDSEAEMADPRLRMAFCRQTTREHAHETRGRDSGLDHMTSVSVKANFHVGGQWRDGAMSIRIAVYYTEHGGSHREIIGITDPLTVLWHESSMVYVQIRPRGGMSTPLGGVYLKHRLVRGGPGDWGRSSGLPADRSPETKADLSMPYRSRDGDGGYQRGSEEERLFRAKFNSEAQTRALEQRKKLLEKNPHSTSGRMRMEHGYRTWTDLDSLFITLGPHPVVSSDSVGPGLTRAYDEQHEALRHVENSIRAWDQTHPLTGGQAQKLGVALTGNKTPAQLEMDREMVEEIAGWMLNENPHNVQQVLRPVVCQDPERIMADKNMTWCPDPPMYVPLKNLNGQDRETLRLAMWDPHECAKLSFMDVSPNYRISEDVWAVANVAKQAKPARMRAPKQRPRRVKDDCIMA